RARGEGDHERAMRSGVQMRRIELEDAGIGTDRDRELLRPDLVDLVVDQETALCVGQANDDSSRLALVVEPHLLDPADPPTRRQDAEAVEVSNRCPCIDLHTEAVPVSGSHKTGCRVQTRRSTWSPGWRSRPRRATIRLAVVR